MTDPRADAYLAVQSLADWSPWVEFTALNLKAAPRLPGVYMIRNADTGQIVYVGSAGERLGGGRPMGLAGRLAVYSTGKAATSGFGEAAFDRALADPDWLESRIALLRTDGPERAKLWAAAAFRRYELEICWTTLASKSEAERFEKQIELMLRAHGIWNR